jgi:hypothetical protein
MSFAPRNRDVIAPGSHDGAGAGDGDGDGESGGGGGAKHVKVGVKLPISTWTCLFIYLSIYLSICVPIHPPLTHSAPSPNSTPIPPCFSPQIASKHHSYCFSDH